MRIFQVDAIELTSSIEPRVRSTIDFSGRI